MTGISCWLKLAKTGAQKYMIAAAMTPKTDIRPKPCLNSLRPTPYSFKALYLAICLATAPGMPAVEMIMNKL